MILVDKIADDATWAQGNNFTPTVYVRGCSKVMIAFRCSTDQTGAVTPNWRSSEDSAMTGPQETAASQDATAINASAISPSTTHLWHYTGIRPTTMERLAQKYMACRLFVATADLINVTAYLIRVWPTDDPAAIGETSEALSALLALGVIPAQVAP